MRAFCAFSIAVARNFFSHPASSLSLSLLLLRRRFLCFLPSGGVYVCVSDVRRRQVGTHNTQEARAEAARNSSAEAGCPKVEDGFLGRGRRVDSRRQKLRRVVRGSGCRVRGRMESG
jgi:hypothetical protein